MASRCFGPVPEGERLGWMRQSQMINVDVTPPPAFFFFFNLALCSSHIDQYTEITHFHWNMLFHYSVTLPGTRRLLGEY